MRLPVLTLLFTFMAAFHTAIPPQAEAASALFRVKQSSSGFAPYADASHPRTWMSYISPDYHPRTMGPSEAPPATAVLMTLPSYATPGFSVPSKVIKSYGTRPEVNSKTPYFRVTVMNSYWNAKGSFGPNNGPTTTTVFQPVSLTTLFSGNYAFSRSGTIRISPGPSRFGGTLSLLAGANHVTNLWDAFARSQHSHTPIYVITQYGAGTRPFYDSSNPTQPIPTAYRYKMTSYSYNLYTTGTPNSPGDYYRQKVMYIHSVPPRNTTVSTPIGWTTGHLTVSIRSGRSAPGCFPPGFPLCFRPITSTADGYDNRTTMGLNGNVSLVRPRLVHSYVVPHDPSLPIRKERTFARIDRITIQFLPEPGSMATLAAGLMGLLSLYLYRRD